MSVLSQMFWKKEVDSVKYDVVRLDSSKSSFKLKKHIIFSDMLFYYFTILKSHTHVF